MLSKYLAPGDRLEMTAQETDNGYTTGENRRTGREKIFRSRVLNLLGEDGVEIEMPVEEGQMQLLPVGRSYSLCFYTARELMQCYAVVAERYKVQNAFVLRLVLTSSLRKFQRREYYRYHCVIDMQCRKLEGEVPEDRASVELLDTDITLENGVIVDISGGGARFISKTRYEEDSLVSFRFSLMADKEPTRFALVGRIVWSALMSEGDDRYENRIQFVSIQNWEREYIIKYIFKEERKIRRMEN